MVPLALSLIDHLPDPLEDRLQQELVLLDVAVAAIDGEGFGAASLEERLDYLQTHDVPTPAAWLTVGADTVQVSIATVAGPRANLRLVTVPNDEDAAPDLAVGIREILAQLAVPEPAPAPAPSLRPRLGVGLVVPTVHGSLGPRALVQVEGIWGRSPWGAGGLVALQVGSDQWRLGLGPVGRLGPGLVAARVDLVHLPWVTWVQPRLELGATVVRGRTWVESRLGWAPQRDLVEQFDRTIYDSGRVEWTIAIGLRQMSTR